MQVDKEAAVEDEEDDGVNFYEDSSSKFDSRTKLYENTDNQMKGLPVVSPSKMEAKEASEEILTSTHAVPEQVDTPAREIILECDQCTYSTSENKMGRLKKRLENHLLKCIATVSMVEGQPNILRAEVTMTVGAAQCDGHPVEATGDDLPAEPLPELDVMPGHIVHASLGRLDVQMLIRPHIDLTPSLYHQVPQATTGLPQYMQLTQQLP